MSNKTDVSYGIIPLRRVERGWEVFLIHQHSRIGGNTYWTLPKGHPEAGESPEATARRELKEETGLVPDTLLETPTFVSRYTFYHDKALVDKTVTFFIGIIADPQSRLEAEEVEEAGWFVLSEAVGRLDHENTKQLFAQVIKFVESGLCADT